MRKNINLQLSIGQIPIEELNINADSRDAIPKTLRALQFIYQKKETRQRILDTMIEYIKPKQQRYPGRPGMDCWTIFVLGILKLSCNLTYDRLLYLANTNNDIRMILGNGLYNGVTYKLQTVRDNLKLLNAELLDKLNKIVVDMCHIELGLSEDSKLNCSADSFVVLTDVDFPTDRKLLCDSMKYTIKLLKKFCEDIDFSIWRKSNCLVKKLLSLKSRIDKWCYRNRNKSSKGIDPELCSHYKDLYDYAKEVYLKMESCYDYFISDYNNLSCEKQKLLDEINKNLHIILIFFNQIEQRVFEDKKISNSEKLYSFYEPHTEWINKGKMGVPVELGKKVCIMKDQKGFILNYHVEDHESDSEIAVSFVSKTKELYSNLHSCSFDKAFYSHINYEELSRILDVVILPKRGKLSESEKQRESSEIFRKHLRRHFIVESVINSLHSHGLHLCREHGKESFVNYVSLGILSYNVHLFGSHLQKQAKESLYKSLKKNRLTLIK